jgi:hypothetical protein
MMYTSPPLLFFSHVKLTCHTMMRIVQQALIPISAFIFTKGKRGGEGEREGGEGGGYLKLAMAHL